jgi:predicted small metal-binding protein
LRCETKEIAMTDPDIFKRANELSEEEERLYEHAGDGHGLTAEETDRLEAIKVELDRCYDLLHQRRARREAGLDPADAQLRPGGTVEKYDQ